MLEYLKEIERASGTGSISLYLPPGFSVSEIGDSLRRSSAYPIPGDLNLSALNTRNGAAIFWGDTQKCLVIPPFPLSERAISCGYVTEPLSALLSSDFIIGLVLVHLGSYAVGILKGERLISSKVGTGLIHGRHKKGGSSQQRFQRRRENQAQEFLDRVCLNAQYNLEPYKRQVNYIAYGGPRQTVIQLQKRCAFLQSFKDRVLPLLDVPAPRQRVLEATISRIWSSHVIDWQEE
ncbi:Vms1/Ankzf1 family peptidyl-tRNA hydrolase [Chloroflexota bacterium]